MEGIWFVLKVKADIVTVFQEGVILLWNYSGEKWASLLAQGKCLRGTWGATSWGIFKGKSDKNCQAQQSLQNLKSQSLVHSGDI